MTKIGAGKNPVEKPSLEKHHREFHQSALKFLKALEKFQNASQEEREHFKGVMDNELLIIEAEVKEIHRPGMHKQYVKMENSYKAFFKDPSLYAALKHDFETLRDYNKL